MPDKFKMHTCEYERHRRHDEGRNPHEEDGGDGNVDRRPAAELFDNVKAVTLNYVVWVQYSSA